MLAGVVAKMNLELAGTWWPGRTRTTWWGIGHAVGRKCYKQHKVHVRNHACKIRVHVHLGAHAANSIPSPGHDMAIQDNQTFANNGVA